MKPFKRVRGCGYCVNTECQHYLKQNFLNTPDAFFCGTCKVKGLAALDSYEVLNSHPLFRQVRLEFNFDPAQKRYRGLAIVTDDSMVSHANVFSLCIPTIGTEKLALTTAERVLNHLLATNDPSEVRYFYEDVLELSSSEFYRKLEFLDQKWIGIKNKLETENV